MPKVAKQSFAFGNKDGTISVVNEDDLYEDDHPFVKARPDFFRDVVDDPFIVKAPKRDRPVEQATAAPGEKRATRK